jgi:hypothetical protein
MFIKKESGGIGYQETVKQTKGMSAEAARLVCKEYKVSCAEVILREDITVDQVRWWLFILPPQLKECCTVMHPYHKYRCFFLSLLTCWKETEPTCRSCTCTTRSTRCGLKNWTFSISSKMLSPVRVALLLLSCCVVWLIHASILFVPCLCSQFGTQMESRGAHGGDMGKVQHAANLHKGENLFVSRAAAVVAERCVARNKVHVLTKQPVVDVILANSPRVKSPIMPSR